MTDECFARNVKSTGEECLDPVLEIMAWTKSVYISEIFIRHIRI